jgi:pimeloyl-ACP methyl ester carboxylesterase
MKKVIQYKNATLAYHVYGNGVPVMLIHGFAETNTIWNNQVEYLSNYCSLIIPDLPGSGESEPYDTDAENMTIDDFAESVYSIIQTENLAQCIMLGHSMGGYVTLAFAEKYPGKLKAFGFVHSTAFADSEEKKQNRKRGIEMMDAYGSNIFLKTTIPGLFAEGFKEKNLAVVNKLIKDGRWFKKESLQQYYYAMMQRPARTDVLKKSSVPVLFLMGSEDIAAPLNDVLKQVHLPEISYIHILENTGHMSMLEMPGKLNKILKDFVNETE